MSGIIKNGDQYKIAAVISKKVCNLRNFRLEKEKIFLKKPSVRFDNNF